MFGTCDCYLFCVDPRVVRVELEHDPQDGILESLSTQISILPLSTTVIVILNYVDDKENWKTPLESLQAQCTQVIESHRRGFDPWVMPCCAYQGFGVVELNYLFLQPFYQKKMTRIQSLLRVGISRG